MGEQGINSPAERAKNFLTSTLLKAHFCGLGPLTSVDPFVFMGPITCMGPSFASVWPFYTRRAFHCNMGPVHPREARPLSEVLGVV